MKIDLKERKNNGLTMEKKDRREDGEGKQTEFGNWICFRPRVRGERR
jgi:hypothetical protein